MLRKNRHFAGLVLAFLLLFTTPSYSETLNIASLSFSWSSSVGLSIFNREQYIWLVFDQRQNVDINKLSRTLKRFDPQILQIPHTKATVLRIKLNKKGVYPYVRKEGLLWIVDFIEGDGSDTKIKNIQTIVQYDSLKRAYVFIPTTDFAEPISVLDPEIGDILFVSPATEAGIGMHDAYNFIDFDFLKSAQGLAVSSKIDDLRFIKGNRGLSLKAVDRNLNISDNLEVLKRQQQLMSKNNDKETFTLSLPEGILAQDYNQALQAFLSDIRNTAPEHKDKARFELAKYYVAKGLGFEALGVIDKILKNDAPNLPKEKIYGIRGVANFLTKRYNQAIEDFSYGKLANNDNAIFWKSLSKLAINPQLNDNGVLMAFISVIKDYPQEIKDRIALIGAQSAINSRDDLSAQNFIDILKLSHKNTRIKAHLHYLMAQNLYLQGYAQNAYKEFRLAIAADSQKYSSFARFDAALLGYKIKAIKITDAIAELEKVKLSWGEKSFKIKVLDSLSKLYIANKDYYSALKAMQNNLKLVDKAKKTEITHDIITLFENIYIHNQADDISALKSLSLYDEFLPFIKKSKKYTEIVIKVSDRFVAVDLLSKAKKILEEEFKKPHVSKDQRYKIGTRLALIYIFEDSSKSAIAILEASEYKTPQNNLDSYRNVLMANAHKKLGHTNEALNILKDDFSKPALLLKSEIFWAGQRWFDLSENLKYLIEEPVEGQTLDDAQTGYILDWLMALRKSGKDTVIVRARNKFAPFFKNNKYASTFDVLTSNLEYQKIDTKEIANIINNMISYSDFTKAANISLEKIGK